MTGSLPGPSSPARPDLTAVARQVLGASGLAEDARAVAEDNGVVHRSRARSAAIPAPMPPDREVLA